MQNKLKIDLVLDQLATPAWLYLLIEKLVNQDLVEIQAIFLTPQEKVKSNSFIHQIHLKIDRLHFKPQPDALEIKDAAVLLKGIPIQEIESIRTNHPTADLILWLSEQNIPEWIYENSKNGVWYFIHGAEQSINSARLGYKEFINLEGTIQSSLVSKKGIKDKEIIIDQSWTMMPTISISRGRNEHFWKILSFVIRGIKRLSDKNSNSIRLQRNDHSLPIGRNYGENEKISISNILALNNLGKHGSRMLHKAWRKMRFREQWILLIQMGNGPSQSFEEFKPILPPKEVFWADPFLLFKNDRYYLFFEELPYATDKGHICVVEIDKSGNISTPQKVLETPYHLSYPFLLEYNGRLFMIPESYQANCIQVFECTSFPGEWKAGMKLMDNVCAMDTTLFHHNGKWWMFTAITENQGASHHDELFLFYADEPLTTEWTPHPMNPIVSDVRRARPAGNIYIENGKIIRPSQDCSRKYGFGFYLNEIITLTQTDYKEKPLVHVRPDWDPKIQRTHTYVHLDGITVIDGLIQRQK